MNAMLRILTVALCLARPVFGADLDPRDFLEGVQGAYRVELAGGHEPKEENSYAEVVADPAEGFLTMPFCGSNGLCDPGYLFIDYSQTQVSEQPLAADHVIYLITTQEGGKSYRYTWEAKGELVSFTNHQYQIGSQVTSLTHVLRRTAY